MSRDYTWSRHTIARDMLTISELTAGEPCGTLWRTLDNAGKVV